MIRIILTLILLIFISCITIGQEIGEIDNLEWKKIEIVQSLCTKSINRIDAHRHKITDLLWLDDESIGKCVVSFNPMAFNRNLNLALQVKDTTSTPFKINFRWFHYDTPVDGSSFEKNYFISDSLSSVEMDLHTLTINNVFPLGFQIYFENNYFSSRMFTEGEDETIKYLYPINQILKQEIIENKVKGILKAEFKFSQQDEWQKRELNQLGELFEVEIEYLYNKKMNKQVFIK